MLGGILRFGGRPWRPGGGLVLMLVVAAGPAGLVVLTERAAGPGMDAPAVGATGTRRPEPAVREGAFPRPGDALPVAAPAPPPAAAPVARLDPPSPAASRPSDSTAATSARVPETRSHAGSWIASPGPLAASPPVRVDVPAIGVTAAIGPLGLNPDGTLEVPRDFARAGWYTGRPTPGETGPAIVVAHRASRRGPGAFWHLPEVQPGQEIVVTRADGSEVVFVVDRVEQHPKDAFPTEAVYGTTPETALRLITCGGPFEPTLGDHYRDNIIVFARMAGVAG